MAILYLNIGKNRYLLPVYPKMVWAGAAVITSVLPRALLVRQFYIIILNVFEGPNVLCLRVFMSQYKVHGFVRFGVVIDV